MTYWRDQREAPEETLRKLQADLVDAGAIARAGGEFDSWDLEVRGGPLGGSRLLLAVEEHAPGKQLLRFRILPAYGKSAAILSAVFATLSIGAWWSGAAVAGVTSAFVAAFVVVLCMTERTRANVPRVLWSRPDRSRSSKRRPDAERSRTSRPEPIRGTTPSSSRTSRCHLTHSHFACTKRSFTWAASQG